MTWRPETVRARFLARLDRALGPCANCTRNCPPNPAMHPRIRGAMNVDLRTIGEES